MTERTPSRATLVARAFRELDRLRDKQARLNARIKKDTAESSGLVSAINTAQDTFDQLTRGETSDEAAS